MASKFMFSEDVMEFHILKWSFKDQVCCFMLVRLKVVLYCSSTSRTTPGTFSYRGTWDVHAFFYKNQ